MYNMTIYGGDFLLLLKWRYLVDGGDFLLPLKGRYLVDGGDFLLLLKGRYLVDGGDDAVVQGHRRQQEVLRVVDVQRRHRAVTVLDPCRDRRLLCVCVCVCVCASQRDM